MGNTVGGTPMSGNPNEPINLNGGNGPNRPTNEPEEM